MDRVLVAFEHDVEAARFRLGGEGFGLTLIIEAGEVSLEPAAGIAAQLHARKPRRSGAIHDRLRGGTVTTVAEDRLEPPERLCLDAFERDGKTFAAGLVLEVDSYVERVDAPDDDAKLAATLDDVCVHESACSHLSPERQGLLVCLTPPEDRLQPADELGSTTTGLLRGLEPGRRARQA
jgi:hypothetical protein